MSSPPQKTGGEYKLNYTAAIVWDATQEKDWLGELAARDEQLKKKNEGEYHDKEEEQPPQGPHQKMPQEVEYKHNYTAAIVWDATREKDWLDELAARDEQLKERNEGEFCDIIVTEEEHNLSCENNWAKVMEAIASRGQGNDKGGANDEENFGVHKP